MLPKPHTLHQMIASQTFRFGRLEIMDIDNSSVLKANTPEMAEQEICLFHRNITDGDRYVDILHERIEQGLAGKLATPVVRFADGEYAFYENNLHCNGLYQQAESRSAIQKAMPAHIDALQTLAESGILAPLIFPGNTHQEQKSIIPFWRKLKPDSSGIKFLDFLFSHRIQLNQDHYIPFYAVYAYLTSENFARLVHNKKICLISSECHLNACQKWFAQFSSQPLLTFVKIPESYVATQWTSLKEKTLRMIPPDTELGLVGAGVGALLVCVDIARRFLIPAIDAGHILNMMNGRVDKSKGSRLYTMRKEQTL